jgi:hypothetical protein
MRPRYRVRSSPRTSQFGKSDNPRNVGGRTKSAARKSRIGSEFRHIYCAQRSSKHHQIYGEGAIGRFLVPEPLPKRLLSSSCASANARAIRWSLDRRCEQILPLFEPGRYPVVLERTDRTVQRSYLQRQRRWRIIHRRSAWWHGPERMASAKKSGRGCMRAMRPGQHDAPGR